MKKLLFLTLGSLLLASAGHAVTFKAKVPEGTKKCYVCGDFSGWDADNALEMQPAGENLFTLDLPEVSGSDAAKGYKYLCGQNWAYVEKDASGGEITNRTAIADPDVVGSWASMPEWDTQSFELTVNNLPRLIKVYTPQGYEESTDSYPVIYYNTVQQRYSNAGDDGNPGDYFFGPKSWNAHDVMEKQREKSGKAYIMVQICSLLAENTIEAHPDFTGTGEADRFLNAFVSELMPYVEKNFRVKTGKENTVIVGADYSAVFSVYAASSQPEKFGKAVAVSPMFWINKSALANIKGTPGQQYYITTGSLEPSYISDPAKEFCSQINQTEGVEAFYTEIEGASHNDAHWKKAFEVILEGVNAEKAPASVKIDNKTLYKVSDTPFENRVFTLYAGEDKNNLQKIGPFVYTADYRKKGTDTPVAAFVNSNEIPVSYKGTYYWNIALGETPEDGWLLSGVKDIGFSSKKTEISWQNVAIFEDESVADLAAHSKGFRVVTEKETVMMTKGENFLSSATVEFPSSDKSFKINFGSVNSSSDMGAVTPSLSVSKNCIEAVIVYDFNLNKVTVSETKFGQTIEDVAVTSFTAVPAVTTVGEPVKVSLTLNNDCDVEIECRKDFKTAVDCNVTKNAGNSYSISLPEQTEGIYSFSVTLVSGETRLKNVAEINVRVLPESSKTERMLTVNAYDGIDWENIGRYKANFHTHTSQSFDTQYSTSQVVDKYQKADYKILALTDHDANPYPWSMFNLYNSAAEDRNPEEMGMLAIPGVELSKDRRNNWSEKTGGEFNHHNDFFTGRQGQEFMSLRESYAYTQAIGGMQIINHPGQYWNLSTEYKKGEKNSPEWHAENFRLYESLIGLEVYNQGNRRPNDRILWDQILTINMPETPVWGYSCDDTHTAEQYFRNYQFMLMPELDVDDLKEAMRNGSTVFSYEFTGSGQALAPTIKAITVDDESKTITIDTDDADEIQWIYSTHRTGTAASTTVSTIVGYGNKFDFTGFQGSYVRARLLNSKGETATQPFGFADSATTATDRIDNVSVSGISIERTNPDNVVVKCTEPLERITVANSAGAIVKMINCNAENLVNVNISELGSGVYVIVAATATNAYTGKFIK